MANTDDTKKMLQIIINGQSTFRQEVLSRIDKLDKKLSGRIDSVQNNVTIRIDKVEKNLTDRIDKIGKQLAYLEYDHLEKRVDKLDEKATLI